MRKLLTRSLSVLAVAALASAGIAFTAGAAQALPATVTFGTQNCDIPTGGTLGLVVDGAELTISNADTVDTDLDYSIVLNFSTTYESGTIEAGDSLRRVIPLPENSDTTIQVFDTSTGGGLIGGSLQSVDCVPNFSPAAVATIADASCVFPTGGIIPPSPGFSFTLDNSKGTGPADYEFIAGDTSVESGVVAAGDTRVRAWSLDEDTPLVATIRSVDAAGDPVTLASKTEVVNCLADTPVITTPTEGQSVLSPVTISGTATAGDTVTIAVGDADALAAGDATGDAARLQAEAVPSTPVVVADGVVAYQVVAGADGTFSVLAALEPGLYGAVAVASREASAGGAVPASVSDPSTLVTFTVAQPAVVPPVTPPVTTPPVTAPTGTNPVVVVPAGNASSGTGALAQTGAAPLVAGVSGLVLLLAGGLALLVIRRRRLS